MAVARIAGVRLAGVTCAVPPEVETAETDAQLYGADEAAKLSATTGVRARRVVDQATCTSDLCQSAAESLLDQLGWERDSIDALLLVTQTPDYLLPATSCCLHGRLGLGKGCAAFDVNLGCSGYVYGLWLASQMLAAGQKRVLLLAGDTASRVCRPQDRGTRPLFGDAGSATALEFDPAAGDAWFVLGSDGGGQQNLIVRQGLFREDSSFGQHRATAPEPPSLFMDGAEIFTFTLQAVPPLVRETLAQSGWTLDEIDAVVMHQANAFILKHLAKRLKVPVEKLPLSIGDYGNTSSASIPITLADQLSQTLSRETLKLLLLGFGVGYSWGAAAISCGPIPEPSVITAAPQARERVA